MKDIAGRDLSGFASLQTMSILSNLSGAFHVLFGFLVFWILQGWGVADEVLSPDTPHPRQPGRFSFVAGQGVALLAQSSLALLCAHALSPIIDMHSLVFLPLGFAGAIYLVEFVSIASNHTLPGERRPIEALSFATGRDLILRHASGLFLAMGLLATVQGTRAAALQASGAVFGWGATVMFWESGLRRSFAHRLRWVLAPLSLLIGLLLVHRAWSHF